MTEDAPRWPWVGVTSGSWWWIGRPGVLQADTTEQLSWVYVCHYYSLDSNRHTFKLPPPRLNIIKFSQLWLKLSLLGGEHSNLWFILLISLSCYLKDICHYVDWELKSSYWMKVMKNQKRNEERLMSCCSVTKLCPTLCNSMTWSMLGFPVFYYLPEFVRTYVHWVSDAIQLSHPLLSPSLPAPNLSQHQGVFQWVVSSHQVARVLAIQLQHQSFQWISSVHWFPLGLTCWISLKSKDFKESSTVPQFKKTNALVLILLYGPILTSIHEYRKNHIFDYTDHCQKSNVSTF